VRVIAPGPEIVAVHPDDVVTFRYEAQDDYGVQSLVAHVRRLNAPPGPAHDIPIQITGDTRRLLGEFRFDLATFAVARPVIGDVLSIVLEARDNAGQAALGDVRHLLVSAQPIDSTARRRITALAAAEETVRRLRGDLVAAQRDAPDRRSHRLAEAIETASFLREALIRAVIDSASPSLNNTLSNFVDAEETCVAVADQAMSGNAPEPEVKAKLTEIAESIDQLHESIVTLLDAERAAVVMAERRMIDEIPPGDGGSSADVVELSALRHQTQATIEESLRLMGLDPRAADLNQQLDQRIANALSFTRGQHRLDFVAISLGWAAELGRSSDWPLPMDRRLAVGALVEAARPDGDLVRANDLQLAANAARRLSMVQSLPAATQPSDDPRTAFPAAMQAMERDERLNADPALHVNATRARELMRKWAGEDESTAIDEPVDAADKLNLAMAANAAAARRQYEQSQRLDDELQHASTQPSIAPIAGFAGSSSAARDVGEAMTVAKQIDGLSAEQARLRTAIDAHDMQASRGQTLMTRRIEQLQKQAPIDRETLQRARAASDAAATALAKVPADLENAHAMQASVASALDQAWSAAIHQAARARLSLTPSTAGLFAASEPRRSGVASQPPGWSRPRGPVSNIEAPSRGIDPAGYEAALKAYFQVLGADRGAKQ
jgi:hypothetical protein